MFMNTWRLEILQLTWPGRKNCLIFYICWIFKYKINLHNAYNKVLWNEPICELQNCKRRFTSYKSYRVLQHNYLPKPAHQSHTQSNYSQTLSLAKTLQSGSTSLPPYSKYRTDQWQCSQVIDTHNTILSKSRIRDWEHEDTATLEVRQISIWLDSVTHLNLPQQGGRWKRLHCYHQTVASWIRCRDVLIAVSSLCHQLMISVPVRKTSARMIINIIS